MSTFLTFAKFMQTEAILKQLHDRDIKQQGTETMHDAVILSNELQKILKEIDSMEKNKINVSQEIQSLESKGICFFDEMDPSKLNEQLVNLYRNKNELDNQNNEYRKLIQTLTEKEGELRSTITEQEELEKTLTISIQSKQENRVMLEQKHDEIMQEIAEVNKQISARSQDIETSKTSISEYKRRIQCSLNYIQQAEETSTHHLMATFMTSISAHTKPITGVSFSNDFKSILTVGEDAKVIQWELPSLGEGSSTTLRGVSNGIRIGTGDSTLACLPGADRVVRIIDLSTWRTAAELSSHTDQCTDAQWMSKNQLITSSKDRTIKLFDLTKNCCTVTIMTISAVFSLCPTNSPSVYAAACFDGSIRLIDTRIKKVCQQIKGVHKKTTACVLINPTKTSLYSIGLDSEICETSLSAASPIRRMTSPELTVKSPMTKISMDPFGGFIAAGSNNGSVLLFDITQNSPKPVILKHHKAAVTCSAFAGNLLVTADRDHIIAFWN
ncbi:autophagy-related protein 16-1 isoform X2 [Histomonas meleagridis]|uniref:autophagy-related protein 16-1 isoform X2 n=1 Tax=Histomonas meleagridis TaxID=135588 RepID=UPI00355AA4CF|nr:autophagy-related protein 16-1 isoform X2 [Histomonas meleagridis]KAH0801755.1 autophagy-related protein 16-1 isoform X2 [Histomonas meleagridis]